MPKSCERCFACEFISNLYSCVLLKHEVGDEIVLEQRAKNCPLRSLDDMKAEIEELPTTKRTEAYRRYIVADDFKENVLEIIDKYKAESEE